MWIEFPIFGASPDGLSADALSADAVIEVKCPTKEKTIANYITKNKIQAKFRAQVQTQMFFAGKQKALFCIAAPNFEESKQVTIYEEQYDEELSKKIILEAKKFWINAIYNILVQ
ncbi:hypothetical protein NQ315_017193 [Exocentrus adspersus]|uniref:YqaJ viral recombinase domain-containing protein n=1 Tax=Exocentrus adspersus TaxID=1586481 RepID=A0AAV8V550_9CUCU|nr:hypothetical protein NQ315_017193 [Exocentrus adspersus]